MKLESSDVSRKREGKSRDEEHTKIEERRLVDHTRSSALFGFEAKKRPSLSVVLYTYKGK